MPSWEKIPFMLAILVCSTLRLSALVPRKFRFAVTPGPQDLAERRDHIVSPPLEAIFKDIARKVLLL